MAPPTAGHLLVQAHALDGLRALPDECVHCVVTSPPYFGLRDYKTPAVTWGDGWRGHLGLEPTPSQFIAHLVEVFREARRVLRSDGVAFVVLGDSYAHDRKWGGRTGGRAAKGMHGTDTVNRERRDTGLKSGDLMGIPWRFAFAAQADGWILRSGVVWCLSGGTMLYARTQKGDAPAMLKDLVRLRPETVQLWTGERWTRVVSWTRSEEPRDGALEVEFATGERVGCTPGHVWPTARGDIRAKDLVVGDVVRTTTLPEPSEPDMPALLPDQEVGWFVGRYLADGSTSEEQVALACHAQERDSLVATLRPLARSLHGSISGITLKGQAANVTLTGPVISALARAYIYGTNARNKGLQPRAWRRSNVFLRALLEGYLSGDGHYDSRNDRWRLGFTRNDRLAADLRAVCARLGVPLRLLATHGRGFGKAWPIYHGDLRLAPSAHWNARRPGEVAVVRRSRARQFWDVEVEDPSHLFALASGLLTHNSKKSCMPESVTGTRWERHRVKLAPCSAPNTGGIRGTRLIEERGGWTPETHPETRTAAEWADCPGCPKCEPNDGLVLRRGMWRPTSAHEYIFMLAKSEDYFADGEELREQDAGADHARNVLHQPEPSGGILPSHRGIRTAAGRDGAGRNVRSVWHLGPEPFPEAHFAVFPSEIPRRCILAGTSPGGCCAECGAPVARVVERTGHVNRREPAHQPGNCQTKTDSTGWAPLTSSTGRFLPTCGCPAAPPVASTVLDPFAGSGTTGEVALALGRRFIGFDLSAAYLFGIARERVRAADVGASLAEPLRLRTIEGPLFARGKG